METKHTPGPWEATNDPYEDGKPYFTIGNDRSYRSGGLNFSGIMKPEDAYLIAAAPDLLETLKSVKTHLQLMNTREGLLTDYYFKQIDELIAKAEGR